MIDSGCADHLSPFKDDFAHLGNQVRHAVIANRQKVPMYGPGKIIIHQHFKGSEPLVLNEVYYAPHAGHRLLSVPTLTYYPRLYVFNQRSRIQYLGHKQEPGDPGSSLISK
jgi:hypothetical protein